MVSVLVLTDLSLQITGRQHFQLYKTRGHVTAGGGGKSLNAAWHESQPRMTAQLLLRQGFLQAKNKQWTRVFWHKVLTPGRTGYRLTTQPVYIMVTVGVWQKPELPRLWDLMAQHTQGHVFERGIRNQDRVQTGWERAEVWGQHISVLSMVPFPGTRMQEAFEEGKKAWFERDQQSQPITREENSRLQSYETRNGAMG